MSDYLPLQVAPKASNALLEQMRQRFLRLAQHCKLPTVLQADYWQEIQEAHENPNRPYHNLVHLNNMLGLMMLESITIVDPLAFELAIWYHDLVYEVTNSDNEVQSAARMVELWQTYVPEEQLCRGENHILATAGHQVRTDHPDERLFLDADLAILAATPTVYQQYSKAIALEYGALYPLALYQIGRTQILEKFLKRDHLFLTRTFQTQYTIAAHANLEAELRDLQGG